MSMLTLLCHERVSTKPDYPETFQDIPIQHHKTSSLNLDLKLYVRFEKHGYGRNVDMYNIPSLLSSHYISCDEFFQNGPSFLRRYLLFFDLLTDELLDELIPNIMASAKELWSYNKDHSGGNILEYGLVLPLAIGVIVDIPMDVEIEEIAEVIVLDYMQETNMIPATEEVIQSLNTTKFLEGSNGKQCCCICLEDFDENMEVSAMPCYHIYHHNCVVQWLKTSHVCPLCRYPMPTIK